MITSQNDTQPEAKYEVREHRFSYFDMLSALPSDSLDCKILSAWGDSITRASHEDSETPVAGLEFYSYTESDWRRVIEETIFEANGVYVAMPVHYPKCAQIIEGDSPDLFNERLSELVAKFKETEKNPPTDPEFDINKERAIVNDTLRASLAIQTIKQLATLGVNIVLVEGSSSEAFLARASCFRNVSIIPASTETLSGSKRLGMAAALQEVGRRSELSPHKFAPVVIQMEPEKVMLSLQRYISAITNQIRFGHTPVVTFERGFDPGDRGLPDNVRDWLSVPDDADTRGYPSYQFYNELYLNTSLGQSAADILGISIEEFKIRFGKIRDLLNGTRAISMSDHDNVLHYFFANYEADGYTGGMSPDRYFNAVYAFYLLMVSDGRHDDIGEVAAKQGDNLYGGPQAAFEGPGNDEINAKRDDQRGQLAAFVRALANLMTENKSILSEKKNFLVTTDIIEEFKRIPLPDGYSIEEYENKSYGKYLTLMHGEIVIGYVTDSREVLGGLPRTPAELHFELSPFIKDEELNELAKMIAEVARGNMAYHYVLTTYKSNILPRMTEEMRKTLLSYLFAGMVSIGHGSNRLSLSEFSSQVVATTG